MASQEISLQARMLYLLLKLQKEQGMGYLLISHHPEVIKFMAHEVGVLEC